MPALRRLHDDVTGLLQQLTPLAYAGRCRPAGGGTRRPPRVVQGWTWSVLRRTPPAGLRCRIDCTWFLQPGPLPHDVGAAGDLAAQREGGLIGSHTAGR